MPANWNRTRTEENSRTSARGVGRGVEGGRFRLGNTVCVIVKNACHRTPRSKFRINNRVERRLAYLSGVAFLDPVAQFPRALVTNVNYFCVYEG